MVTYTQSEAAIGSARDDIIKARKRFENGQEQISVANNLLSNMSNTYSQAFQFIVDALATNPDDVALKVLDARKAQIVAEFQALKTETQAAIDVLAAL